MRLGSVAVQMIEIGVRAMPIVGLMSATIGVMLAIQGIHTLKIFGAESQVAVGIAFSMVREFGPLITSILVAGRSAYAGRRLFGGETTFVLAGSGHIASVVNPPHKNKYFHRVNPTAPEGADEWLKNAETHEGSWWPHWRA